jgi:pimeloyl-ACP methyl ester carboxylesterase
MQRGKEIRVRRLMTIGAIAGLLAGAAGASVPALAAASAPQTTGIGSLHWGTCTDPLLQQAHAKCALLSVPLNYAHPRGPKIQIAVSRILHTSSARNYQGIILTNPGGPGGSGLNLNTFLIPVLQAEHLGAAAADYDWIGFDPRGVGSSVPALTCEPNYFSGDRLSYNPTTRAILKYWLARSAGYARACETHSAAQAALLRNDTTVDSARDMDSIRQALGKSQITYYGFSYGTYLGQVYSTLFPRHVRRLILDSNVDPRTVWYQANLNQDAPFNRNVNIWFGWLAKYNRVFHLGRTERAVQRLWYAEKARLGTHPILGQVGPDEWTDAFLFAGYFEQTWVQLGSVFANWEHTHSKAAGQAVVAAYQAQDTPGNDNGFAGYLAVECTDAHWPLSWARWARDNTRINRAAPFETWGNAWFNAPCRNWEAPMTRPVRVNGRGVRSALLIDETLDAATPFQGSLEVRRLFPHSVLLAEPGGTTHADSLSGDLCVDGTIGAYLENGTLPARHPGALWDKTCRPLPQPVPTGTVSASTGAAPGMRASMFGPALSQVGLLP